MRLAVNFFGLVLCFGLFTTANAQSTMLNAEKPSDVSRLNDDQTKFDDDKPLPYGYVGDRDIMWYKIVWEKIDLDQKINYPLLYPLNDNSVDDSRRSLFQVLVDAMEEAAESGSDTIGLSQVYATSYFNEDGKKSMEEIKSATKAIFLPNAALSILGQYEITGTENVELFKQRAMADELGEYPELYPQDLIDQMKPYMIPTEITAANIREYHIKGMWYFDKRQGELKYRMLGIAPAGYDINSQNPTFSGDPQVIPYFWVWFPDARQVLHDAKVLNPENGSKPISFDHLLNSRRFSSFIYKTENMYEDRQIKEYIPDNSQMQLLEAERLKEEIRNFELDMWNY